MNAFPFWALWAVLGHISNGAAFVIDKTLLRKSFRQPATYAGLIGLLGILAVVLLPFGVHVPSNHGWIPILVSGATFPLALWFFFIALAKGEATRVVPVVGSLIPVLTLMATSVFLGERFENAQLGGFALLVFATILLSGAGGKTKGSLRASTVGAAVISAVLFTTSFVTVKVGYDAEGFISTFAFSRFAGVIAAIAILAWDERAYMEIRNVLFPGQISAKQLRGKRLAFLLVLFAQSLGAAGFVLVQYAISLGSAALVNAIQAVQYAFLVLVAFLFAKKAPDLLGENLTPAVVARKLVAICFVAAGLWLIV